MRIAKPKVVTTILYSCLLLLPWQAASAQTARARVQAAVEELHKWLGQDDNAQAWRRYLKSDQLLEQLEQGTQPDRDAVAEVLEAYRSEAKGLERSQFVAVRRALEAWLKELPRIERDELPDAARAAQSAFRPITKEDVERAKKQLVDAMEALDQYLALGSQSNAERWKAYLRWTEVQQQLDSTDGPDWKVLLSVARKYYDNVNGLERPQFTAVRAALRDYANAVLFSSNPKAQQYYERYLNELAERLESYAKGPRQEDAISIGKTLGWLERFHQASDLIEAVRQHHSHPNFYAQVSEDMLRTGVDRNVDERMKVREVIMGTSVHSKARMRGRIMVDLVPNPEKAAIDIVLSGTTKSTNVGYNGPVTIYSTSTTTVDARKRILVSAEGIAALPARADCNVRTRVNSIAGGALAQSIAWNRVAEQKHRAEIIASRRAERRVEENVDEQVAELVERGNDLFVDSFRNPLIRRGGFPQILRFSTTDDALHVVALEAGADQLAAPNEPPPIAAGHDVAVRVHESLIANLSQAALGGITLTDERLASLVERLTGSVPEELVITDETDPWSITFAAHRPVDVRFDDGRVMMTIRGTRFTRGTQELKRSVSISATYRVERTAEGAHLEREGDVRIEFPGSTRLSASQVAMKAFMKKRFEAMFKPEFESDGIELPGQWKEAGKLRLEELVCDDGWLALGWHQPLRAARTAKKD